MVNLDGDGVISEDLAKFITSQISIHLASCSNSLEPTLVRALGCRLSEDRCRVSISFPRSQSTRLQQDIEETGRIAAVFNEPESHRTFQMKGYDALLEPATEQDKLALPGYLKAFSARLACFDVTPAYIYALCHCDSEDLLLVTFSPASLYLQTPGNNAGKAIS